MFRDGLIYDRYSQREIFIFVTSNFHLPIFHLYGVFNFYILWPHRYNYSLFYLYFLVKIYYFQTSSPYVLFVFTHVRLIVSKVYVLHFYLS